MYSWADVAERTERVYARAMATPCKDTYERMSRYDTDQQCRAEGS
jgi:phosphatidylinositol glycan class A protein